MTIQKNKTPVNRNQSPLLTDSIISLLGIPRHVSPSGSKKILTRY